MYSVQFLGCLELHKDLVEGCSSGPESKEFTFEKESNKAKNPSQSRTSFWFG